jgi:hypothetical protein
LAQSTSLDNTYLVDAVSATNLTGGDDGENALIASDFTNAIDNVLNSEDWDILLIPGQTEDSFHSTVVGKLTTRAANEDKFSIFLTGIDVDETIATAAARTAAGKYLGLVAPNVKTTNRISGSDVVLDGSYLACAYAGLVAKGFPDISATHKTLSVGGLNVLQSSGKEFYNNSEQNTLLNSRIVPCSKIGGVLRPARSVTRIADTTSVFYEQNIVTIENSLKAQVFALLNGFIGEPNLARVRDVIAKNVDGILQTSLIDEVIADYQPTQVSVGASADTVNVEMTVLPTFALNFIKVNLTFTSS